MNAKTKTFHVAEVGPFSQIGYEDPKMPKKFLKDILGLTGMEISVTTIPAGKTTPFFHSHKQNEELYICIEGSGEVQLDDELIPFKEGTMINVLPEARRGLRASADEALVYLCIQAKTNSLEQYTKSDGIKHDDVEWVSN
jgi:uncharacterized cupin superfamily protein